MKAIINIIRYLKEENHLSLEEIIEEMAIKKVYDVILRNALLAVFGGQCIDEIYKGKNQDNPFNNEFFEGNG